MFRQDIFPLKFVFKRISRFDVPKVATGLSCLHPNAPILYPLSMEVDFLVFP